MVDTEDSNEKGETFAIGDQAAFPPKLEARTLDGADLVP
jgi:hypothetical protein